MALVMFLPSLQCPLHSEGMHMPWARPSVSWREWKTLQLLMSPALLTKTRSLPTSLEHCRNRCDHHCCCCCCCCFSCNLIRSGWASSPVGCYTRRPAKIRNYTKRWRGKKLIQMNRNPLPSMCVWLAPCNLHVYAVHSTRTSDCEGYHCVHSDALTYVSKYLCVLCIVITSCTHYTYLYWVALRLVYHVQYVRPYLQRSKCDLQSSFGRWKVGCIQKSNSRFSLSMEINIP